MKAIILISSIFYLIGLFIGNKIDLVKRSIPVEKIIIHKIQEYTPSKCFNFSERGIKKTETDTVKSVSIHTETLLKNKVL